MSEPDAYLSLYYSLLPGLLAIFLVVIISYLSTRSSGRIATGALKQAQSAEQDQTKLD